MKETDKKFILRITLGSLWFFYVIIAFFSGLSILSAVAGFSGILTSTRPDLQGIFIIATPSLVVAFWFIAWKFIKIGLQSMDILTIDWFNGIMKFKKGFPRKNNDFSLGDIENITVTRDDENGIYPHDSLYIELVDGTRIKIEDNRFHTDDVVTLPFIQATLERVLRHEKVAKDFASGMKSLALSQKSAGGKKHDAGANEARTDIKLGPDIMDMIHVVGIVDRPHQKTDVTTKLAFVFCNGKEFEKELSADIDVDGLNATQTIISTLESYKDQFQLIFLNGIMMGGLNIVDMEAVHEALGRPVITVTDNEPEEDIRIDSIHEALKHVPGEQEHLAILEKAGGPGYMTQPRSNDWHVFYRMEGIDWNHADQCLKKFLAKDRKERLPECLILARKAAMES